MAGKYTYTYRDVEGSRKLGGIFRFRTEEGRAKALAKLVEDVKRPDVVKQGISVVLYDKDGMPLEHYAACNRNLHLLLGMEQ